MKQIKLHFIFLFLLTASGLVTVVKDSVHTLGSFEQDLPVYLIKVSEASGSSLSWVKDEFVGIVKYSIAAFNPCDKMRITAWIKGENLHPDSVATTGDQWSVSLTPIILIFKNIL